MLGAACGNDEDVVSNNNKNNEQTSDNQTETEPFEFSIMLNLHTPEVPSEMLQGLLEAATNTKLDIQWIPDKHYEERGKAAFSSNSLPQALVVNATELLESTA